MMAMNRRAVAAQVQVGLPVAGMVLVEPMANGDAHQEDEAGNDPIVVGGESEGVVIGKHQEQNGECEVVVVGRAELRNAAIVGIGRASGFEISDYDFLVGNDDEKDVRRHDRGGECTEVEQVPLVR